MLRAAGSNGLLGSLLLILAACASPAERPGAQAAATTDEFSKTIDIEGPMMVTNPFVGIKSNYNLVTHVDKQTHIYTHVIETELDYDGNFIVFQFASDNTAQTLQFIPIKRLRNYGCGGLCDRTELFNIVVPDSFLRAHASSGYRVKVSARTGDSFILSISPAMISAQYQSLNAVLSPSPAPQATIPTTAAAAEPAVATASVSPSAVPPRPAAQPAPASLPASKGLGSISHVGLQMMPRSTSELTHGNMHGAVILGVIPGSPADAAGIHGGDLIVKFDGHAVDSGNDIQDVIAKIKPNSVVRVDILRGPTQVRVDLKL